ncbi:fungal-specific transcription factor domain-containing protein [Daldinia caldariorum]|uniref:fungal-specific transcription factor domain-containing protein n=1 Tax=Daldinia caldariorum TaxID=326644 RepID=UPI0020077115|nr:fungal-specific transcription factor domain-containing protein [Daldinia caldariorum]KAI1471114.1 fungal-specific transcription factor domain-containing protein [Daldinia caldariorum]
MFHNFKSHRKTSPSPPAPARLNKSCSECTRRKVKCDGGHPCSSCTYYKVSHLCNYRQRNKRNAVSRSTLEEVSDRLRSRTEILEQLFPNTPVDELIGKSRDELLDILRVELTPKGASVDLFSRPAEYAEAADDSAQVSENGEPVADRQWNESRNQAPIMQAADDINAINLATDKHRRSYLGVTSISAILRTIFRLCPSAKHRVAEQAKRWSENPIQPQPYHQSQLVLSMSGESATHLLKEQRCIDFYFEHIHPIVPMLDEEDFRNSYSLKHRRDAGWLGLLNMVITLGSIASGSDTLHEQYYEQARNYLDLDSFGSGNLESLQALCLLGGLYLHYRNAPNMAYAILGAAHRVAIALGLHRESRHRNTHATRTQEDKTSPKQSRAETKRRTWWSLFCLDTWASMTLGRPTCGRWDSRTMDTPFPTLLTENDYMAMSLCASLQFCLISNRIQNRFARLNRLTMTEITSFDEELQAWYASTPLIFRSMSNSSSRFTIAREFMRNRYLNIRLILLRSLILYFIHNRIHKDQLGAQELQIIDTCRLAAGEAIDSIALHWTPNRIHVWNSAWYLFQACMVPLLFIVIEQPRPDTNAESLASARASLVKALETFSEMKPWMRASDRASDIISAIYEAITGEVEVAGKTPYQDGDSSFFGWYDEQLAADLDWGSFLMDDDLQGAFLTVQ